MEALEDRTVPTIVNVSALSDITEGGSYGIVQFSRDTTSGSLSLSFTITGTATNGTDYTLSTSSPVSFASGVATANVNVTPIDDAFVEGTETIIFTIDSGSYTIGTGSATMNLYDNDLSPPPPPPPPPPTTVVSVASLGNITEGGSSGTFELTRNNTTGTLSVPFSLSGSATSLIDYNVSPTAPATFASGSATADITISPVDDSNVEGTESINITLGIGAYTIGTGSATMDLFDNDNTQVSIASDGDVTEGDTGTFTITRTGSTASSLSVSYSMSGTATSGTDYTAPSGSATIPAGDSSVDVSIPTLADNLVEGDETVIATVADGGSSYSAHGSSATATMTIHDDPPIITLTPTNVIEGNSSDVIFTRSGGDISSSLTIGYTVGGTATSGTDYTALSGSVTIAAGETSAIVTIAALADNIVELGNETVSLEIFSTTSYVPPDNASNFTGVVTIVDNPPVLSVIDSSDTIEGGIQGCFVFTREGGDLSNALGVSYTASGTALPDIDYISLSGYISFDANSTTADVELISILDNFVEGNETVIITLSSSDNYVTSCDNYATITIVDNPPQLSVIAIRDATEGGDPGQFSFSRSGGDITQTLTAAYSIGGTATPGDDYLPLSGTLTFSANETSIIVTITAYDDHLADPDESIIATIQSNPNYLLLSQNEAKLDIIDSSTGSISGRVWNDYNDDGIQDTEEEGSAGIRVQLMENGSEIQSINSDIMGNYTFVGVAPASDYQVEFDQGETIAFSPENQGDNPNEDSDVDPTTGCTENISVSPLQSVVGVAAGIAQNSQRVRITFADGVNLFYLTINMKSDFDGLQPKDTFGLVLINTRTGQDARNILLSLLQERNWAVDPIASNILIIKGYQDSGTTSPQMEIGYSLYPVTGQSDPVGPITVFSINGATVNQDPLQNPMPSLDQSIPPAAWMSFGGNEMINIIISIKTESGLNFNSDLILVAGPDSNSIQAAEGVADALPEQWDVDTDNGGVRILGIKIFLLGYAIEDPITSITMTCKLKAGQFVLVTPLPTVMGVGGVTATRIDP